VRHGQINDDGGGIKTDRSLTLTDVAITENDATTDATTGKKSGGGIFHQADNSNFTSEQLTLNRVTISGNTASLDGGGLRSTATSGASLTDVAITDNQAGNGGGISYQGNSLTHNGGTISGNTASLDGGGLHSTSGIDRLTDVAITDNQAGNGGGISHQSSQLVFNGVTISGNKASLDGGGLYSFATTSGSGSLTNVTITNNSATGNGGGLRAAGVNPNLALPNLNLSQATVSHNSAPNGSNISRSTGPVSLRNTIVSDGSGGANCAGAVQNFANNLDSGTSCGFVTASNSKSSADAKLGDLADNGGPTKTRTLLSGSAAIDAGNGFLGTSFDQRHEPRPKDGDGNGTAVHDIGAYELQAPLNAAPVAIDDAATTNEDTSVAIDVKANDTDASGNSLSVVASSLSDPANGAVALITSGADDAGKVLYTPDSNYNNSGGPNADTFTYKVSNSTAESNAATVRVNVNPVNDSPTTPGAITSSESLNNGGTFTLDWGASTDVDSANITYTLEKRDSDDANWSEVDSDLTLASYAFGGTNPVEEDEGTWDYRVKAVDSPADAESDYSTAEKLVKVDKSGPNDPTLSFNTSANQSLKATVSGVDWYKDSALIDVAANGDPALADASDGSGVDAASLLPNPFSVSTNGTSTASRKVSDNATNESAAGELQVNVDAANPTLGNGNCPTAGPFILNSGGGTQSVTITASDGESGVDNASSTLSGSVNTSTVGEKTVTFKAVDHVGHEVTKECNYNVNYDFGNGSGGSFSEPVRDTELNEVKAGAGVPVKFGLGGDFGLSIFATGYPTSKKIACNTGLPVDPIEETVTITNSGLKYDAAAGHYVYGWKTDKTWSGTCRELNMKLADGTDHPVKFQFK
jgi:predicted outer membrane repeat protein